MLEEEAGAPTASKISPTGVGDHELSRLKPDYAQINLDEAQRQTLAWIKRLELLGKKALPALREIADTVENAIYHQSQQ